MRLSKVDAKYIKHDAERFCQGDILRDVTLIQWAEKKDGNIYTTERILPYAVIFSQECDLQQDYDNHTQLGNSITNHDKFLQSILLCPAYLAESLKKGDHLDSLSLKMVPMGGDLWKKLKQNKHYRYHFLEQFESLQIPELVLDFKHYFTVPRDILYRQVFKNCYLASLAELFREDLSVRFAQYLSRIALPTIPSDPHCVT